MTQHISTSMVPEAERYGFWSDVSQKYFVKLDCLLQPYASIATNAGSNFSADLIHCNLGNLDLIDLRATAHCVERPGPHPQEDDYFLLSLLTEGSCQLTQDGRTASVMPGEMVLYDTRRPYRVALATPFRMCSIRIPHETMRIYLPSPEHLVARPLTHDTAMGRIASGLVLNVFNEQEHVDGASKSSMAKSVLEMLAAGLQSLRVDESPVNGSKLAQFHLERIKQSIDTHLGDAELNVEFLAQLLKMSPSSIHRAFESQPLGVSEFIWSKRLEICKQALGNPQLASRSISELAYSWGFTSNAHFSRAFKRYTGYAPREFRRLSAHQQH